MAKGKKITYKQKWLVWVVCVVFMFTYFSLCVYGQPHERIKFYEPERYGEWMPMGKEVVPYEGDIFVIPFTFAILFAYYPILAMPETKRKRPI